MIIKENELRHYGILRRSGRYPWGSGGNTSERSTSFLGMVDDLKRQGLSESDIAKGLGFESTTEFRQTRTLANNEMKAAKIAQAQAMKDKGMSTMAIARRMEMPESSVRALLAPGEADKAKIISGIATQLRDDVGSDNFIQVGSGIENYFGVSKEKLGTVLALLKDEGYSEIKVQVPQASNPLQKTTIKVLAPPGTTYKDVVTGIDRIKNPGAISDDGGRTITKLPAPMHIDAKRIAVRYGEDGGGDADGVIYVRPGVSDVSLGSAQYAQVRIGVNGTHYLKGMAIYRDDLPPGVDLMFNTPKSNTGNKLDAMKELKRSKDGAIDEDLPFGSIVRPLTERDEKGNVRVKSVMNIVNEEKNWDEWSRNLASQMLSKQKPGLAKQQLGMTYEKRRMELDRILQITNPAVKQKLLDSYADDVDSAAVHLKAAALPRQKTHVILPINSLRDNEVYAPNFNNGEKVVLIRYPHGGTFEIPELVVNNKHKAAKSIIGNATAAIGINAKVAERLSGADFDGDTVVVIPNNNRQITTSPALAGLKNFDPKARYPQYEGMKVMSNTQTEMGKISNLITDMTIGGANQQELARAVRHSMVVIDAEKHKLNYKQSEIDNGIAQLRDKYQPKPDGRSGGASTLLSRSTGKVYVPEIKPRSYKDGGPIDKRTGQKEFTPTGEVTYKRKVNKKTGEVTYVEEPKMTRIRRGELVRDAHELSSGTKMESIYADHSNRLRQLANEARKASVNTKGSRYSPSAKAAYAKEVASLEAKLQLAQRNRPLERQAQVIANAQLSLKRQANPDMTKEEMKKLRELAIVAARARTNAEPQRIKITSEEWNAIQAGAITHSRLVEILKASDLDVVKELATPRTALMMTPTKKARAQSMLNSGYTQAEVASHLGVSLTTLKNGLSGKESDG